MSFNQANEQFNDAFETYFPNLNPVTKWPYQATTLALSQGNKLRARLFGGQLQVNERIVEYPQVLRWIRPQGRVLDIGCVSSRLPIQLASLGYEVHGLDTRAYTFKHPNFVFHQTDLFKWSPPQPFDIILLISVIEHFGLGGYGDLVLPNADREAVGKIAQWLAPGGQLLVSLPFGQAGITTKHRIYDSTRLAMLFADFTWVEQTYFRRVDGAWLPSSAAELSTVASPDLPPNGVAILHLCKKS
ncbi:MAG: DUF268 domain-containing protein [Chloroflexi bacterium]|nr:DUF268 domain-containing protein [Chloroflexota bacterium]